ncbi:MAG: hypothetical protein A2X12_02285 [Bacteroidetes bacterium GWE2_29_8]|nr:MAG: hypothetical protein A2X12_02285 [Bacteroidetes bacterium GWE2_29_8]OFY19165.1 MAG: hypothetical protein A2X02_01605 [Bacteroidetes bacterium GWF2_29_10]
MLIKQSLKILILLFLCIANISLLASDKHFNLPELISKDGYVKNNIIFKIKSEYRKLCFDNEINNEEIKEAFKALGVVDFYKLFPHINQPRSVTDKSGNKLADISLIYELYYNAEIDIEKAINILLQSEIIEYAEPRYIHELLFSTNDPMIAQQYYLSMIKAYQAWDITQGDTNVVIGIVDTGVDIDHPDLISNIKYNHYDIIDGIDNDNDGYKDNYRGWDLGENHNFPQCTNGCHGGWVAGIAVASTNNGTGMAGVGFKCKFLSVKVTNAQGYITKGYEGIIYAVEHGCSIINCSWGSTYSYSRFGEDVITYTSINKNALVVAASGNSGNMSTFYPASYNYVLSVAATNDKDIKKYNNSNCGQSNFGIYIDICAPGENIVSTYDNAVYTSSFCGTSFAAPIISGAAALVKSRYPELTGLQIGEQLKVTSDNIDTIPSNAVFKGFIGAGRVNLYRAVTDYSKPSVVMTMNNIYNQNNSNIIHNEDTVYITGYFVNYLKTSNNIKAVISTKSLYAEVLKDTVDFGYMATLGSKNNLFSPFSIKVIKNPPANYEIIVKITFTDLENNYTGFQYIPIIVSPNFLNVSTDNITMTATGNGKIGYNNNASEGNGFSYKGSPSILTYGSFVIGNSEFQVSDNILDSNSTFDNDFKNTSPPIKNYNPYLPNNDVLEAEFNDDYSFENKLDLLMKTKIIATNDSLLKNCVFLNYKIINNSNQTYKSLYCGLYADWDINDATTNSALYEKNNNFLYFYPVNGGTFTGMSVFSDKETHHYAFDNNGADNSIALKYLYDKNKYLALSTNRDFAGISKSGNDVSGMFSTGPFEIKPSDSIKVTFLIMAGDYLPDLINQYKYALSKYEEIVGLQTINQYTTNEGNIELYPNPTNGKTNINIKNKGKYIVQIINSNGTIVYTKHVNIKDSLGEIIAFDCSYLNSGLYICQIIPVNSKKSIIFKKFIINK